MELNVERVLVPGQEHDPAVFVREPRVKLTLAGASGVGLAATASRGEVSAVGFEVASLVLLAAAAPAGRVAGQVDSGLGRILEDRPPYPFEYTHLPQPFLCSG